jgi:uncharacterized protein (DUF1501 family)
VRRYDLLLLLLCAAWLAAGCASVVGNGGSPAGPTGPTLFSLTVSPASASVPGATTQQFSARGSGGIAHCHCYLSQQLRQVAQVIAVRSALGLRRQIFFCSAGGFDTHSDQLPQHVKLMSDLSPSMNSFYEATQELGVANKVTTFTLSEFSRTL